MTETHVQASFNSGEWAPQLFARVDIQKYRSGAALLSNFYVDYRGGASTRPGTKYVIQAWNSAYPVRVVRFQAGFNVGFCLEFGQNYIRPLYQGAPVLNTAVNITGATRANPCVLTIPVSGFSVGQVIYVANVAGMTQLNGRYFLVNGAAGSSITLGDLNGVAIDSTTYTAYSSGGTAASVFTIASPYLGADVGLLKFAQTNNELVITHPSYPPYTLTYVSATRWVLAQISFGSQASAPTGISLTTSLTHRYWNGTIYIGGNAYYQYAVTSVDAAGEESSPTISLSIGPFLDFRSQYPGTNQVTWQPVTNAVYYKVYAANVSWFGAQPPGIQFGYVGYSTGVTFIDDNISPDFAAGLPVAQNPFVGAGVSYVTVTNPSTYTSVPSVNLTGGSPLSPASAYTILSINGTPAVTAGGSGYAVGDSINFGYGIQVTVTTVSSGAVTAWTVNTPGQITSGSTPGGALPQVSTSGNGTAATATPASWGVGQVILQSPGYGYASAPSVSFSPSGATATTTLAGAGAGNPAVCSFFQQRLVLAAQPGAPQTFNMSQPGAPFNFNVHQPVQPSDAVTGTLVTNTANTIKSIVSVPAGMLVFTDQAAWVVNGGQAQSQGLSSAVSPENVVATAQSFIGANDMPPIVSNYDILFVQSKGAQVRDLAYNIYFNVFTGSDISLIASHLFYGYTLTQWAWAEQPFFVVWCVRSDGVLLALTFLKEQDFLAWSHHSTTNGSFTSVCTVTESTATAGTVDAVYTVVTRVINGNTVQFIERLAERIFPNGLISAWTVDSGQQFTGASTLSFQGAEHLAGQTVTGLAQDNLGNVTVISPFTMPVSGFFTLAAPGGGATGYTTVTIGLGFTCQLQTLPLEVGEPTIQGKPKRINNVTVRVAESLGLSIGSSFSTLTAMQDLIPGAVGSDLTGQPPPQTFTGLYTGDTRTWLDGAYTIPGQYCLQQSQPYPATILGVFPNFTVDREERTR